MKKLISILTFIIIIGGFTYANDKKCLQTDVLDNFIINENNSDRFYKNIMLTNKEKYCKVFY